MKCLGCYIDVKESYCPLCRARLFDKSKILSVLDFDAPNAANIRNFQEHSRQMSISGVQLKYSLCLTENTFALADAKGQYILKPIPLSRHLAHVEQVPENEHLTMQIASQVFKINTARNGLILFKDKQPAYITRRFDVKTDGTKYLQEDFAQLTGRTSQSHGPAYKYDGTYEEIGRLIKKYVAAAMPALENFFKLVVFNYVMSNGDAHLKNFSLIRNENGEYQLTPAYDLISTVIHTPQESDTALDLYPGDIDSSYYSAYGHYGRENFMELARRLDIIPKRAVRILNVFHLKQNELKHMVRQSFLTDQVKELYIDKVTDKLLRL
jgi:serine/threonine-protein kinase HipA